MKNILLTATALLIAALPSFAGVDVVTTTPELAALAKEVAGNLASVQSLARPEANYHQIDAKPSDVVKVARAEVFVRCGMDLDQWADGLLGSARNSKVSPGGPGYVDASARMRKQQVPAGGINGASGDVHPMGNPHYWYDPKNGVVAAYEILLALRRVDPAHAAAYDANYSRFSAEITSKLAGWERQLAPFKGHGFVAYHEEWVYFAQRFGLTEFGFLEPKPGIAPSGGHVTALGQRMKSGGCKAIVLGSIYSRRYADLIAKNTGAQVSVVPYSVGGMGTRTYIEYIDAIVAGFRKALD
jgi:zinc/manganese transport system substrate-binding protein